MNTMRILVLGISGMLGHKIFKISSKIPNLEIIGTARNKDIRKLFPDWKNSIITNMDVRNTKLLKKIVEKYKPEIIINCTGVIKSKLTDYENALRVNSVFPRLLSKILDKNRTSLIQISTDCVFSGQHGGYSEDDIPDPVDIYGISKYLGETSSENSYTIRTSIIGREIQSRGNLLEWFLAQEDQVYGFSNAFFSGITTNYLTYYLLELANMINCEVDNLPRLIHIPGDRISKYELLNIFNEIYDKGIHISRKGDLHIDRSLISIYKIRWKVPKIRTRKMVELMAYEDEEFYTTLSI